ncbi:hypothetical protein RYA05_01715 [Pseudomonas syringae pv. actinidiae]|nr:hypothetical protein [Pseudomonas syringae pv. actinidiae]
MNTGMNAFGNPIGAARRQRAYEQVKLMGIAPAESFDLIEGISELLEQDKPNEAQALGMKAIDLTGVYMVFAFLCTGEEDLPNVPVDYPPNELAQQNKI